MIARADYVALVAGFLTSLSLAFQLNTSSRLYRARKPQIGLNNYFIILTLIGNIMWLYWGVDLFITTDGDRGVFSILWASVAACLLLAIVVLKNLPLDKSKYNYNLLLV
tara:strand:- start:42577 stop:42903 length:327 start_codon:yes stop_codon:yes gene_type:complete